MTPAVNIKRYAQEIDVPSTKVRPVVVSPYPANTGVVPPYSANWKKLMFDKFSGEVTEGMAGHTENSSTNGGANSTNA